MTMFFYLLIILFVAASAFLLYFAFIMLLFCMFKYSPGLSTTSSVDLYSKLYSDFHSFTFSLLTIYLSLHINYIDHYLIL